MKTTNTKEKYELAFRYHRQMPEKVLEQLHRLGLSEMIIHRYRIGWDGEQVTVPITNRNREVVFFKTAREIDGVVLETQTPEHQGPELYGWERIVFGRPQIVVCQTDWERLILESRGFAAIASSSDPAVFLPEWAAALESTPFVYVCFHNDAYGRECGLNVAAMVPHSRIITLPEEVGLGGSLFDYFVRLGNSDEAFRSLMEKSMPLQE